MKNEVSIFGSRAVASLLIAVIVFGPVSPIVSSAQTSSEDRFDINSRIDDRESEIPATEPSEQSVPSTTSNEGATNEEENIPADPSISALQTLEDGEDGTITAFGAGEDTSTSSGDSAEVPAGQSDTDNIDCAGVTCSTTPPPANPNDNRPVEDLSATSTEHAATAPVFNMDSDDEDVGNQVGVGGVVITGDAEANTRLKNTLNITQANGIDSPGQTNSTVITAETFNEAELTTGGDANAGTGENRALGGDSGTATIDTGKAVATAEAVNVVNTNLFNSEGYVRFLSQTDGGSIDVEHEIEQINGGRGLSYFFQGGPGGNPSPGAGCTILTCLNSSTLQVLNTNNADVTNDIQVNAKTGTNAATSSEAGGVDIFTGDAYASANVLNMVNTNFINSSYLIFSASNFGNLQDDIVLPNEAFFTDLLASGATLPVLNSSSFVVNNDNNENFFGTTNATAITGENTATTTGEGHGEILTGNAFSASNSYTAANQTKVGGASVLFTFRVWGEWSGRINGLPRSLSWRSVRADDDKSWIIEIYSTNRRASQGIGAYNASVFLASSTNMANVETNVEVLASTGENFAEVEDGVANIQTGDAYATANVINMVNTNIVNRNWVFGTFNIFGDWSGDISFGGQNPDLRVEVSANSSSVAANNDVTYNVKVTNEGEVAAHNVMIEAAYDNTLLIFSQASVSTLDTTENGLNVELGTIAPGESEQISLTARAQVPSGITPGGSIIVPLTATAILNGQRDQNSRDNSESVDITVTAPTGGYEPIPEPLAFAESFALTKPVTKSFAESITKPFTIPESIFCAEIKTERRRRRWRRRQCANEGCERDDNSADQESRAYLFRFSKFDTGSFDRKSSTESKDNHNQDCDPLSSKLDTIDHSR